jgi:hypothetical protein
MQRQPPQKNPNIHRSRSAPEILAGQASRFDRLVPQLMLQFTRAGSNPNLARLRAVLADVMVVPFGGPTGTKRHIGLHGLSIYTRMNRHKAVCFVVFTEGTLIDLPRSSPFRKPIPSINAAACIPAMKIYRYVGECRPGPSMNLHVFNERVLRQRIVESM